MHISIREIAMVIASFSCFFSALSLNIGISIFFPHPFVKYFPAFHRKTVCFAAYSAKYCLTSRA